MYKTIKSQGFKGAVKSAYSILSDIKTSDKTRGFRAKIGAVANRSRTSLTETTEPMFKHIKDTEMLDIVKSLYYNPLDFAKNTLGEVKRITMNTHFLGMNKEITPIFKEWLKSNSVSKASNTMSLFGSMSYRAKFNKEVFEFMELGLHQENKHLAAAAEISQRYYKSIADKMIEAGVKGADKMQKVASKFYVPRVLNTERFLGKIANIKPDDYEKIVVAFSKMLVKSKNPEAVAKAYIDSIRSTSEVATKFSVKERKAIIRELEKKRTRERRYR